MTTAESMTADRVRAILAAAIHLHERVRAMDVQPVVDAASAIAGVIRGGGKLMVFGNGGSAADAQHTAAELVGRFERERRGLAAMALTVDTSVLTSLANDSGYERVFARQIEALGRPGDAALGISTSGASASVTAALDAARAQGLTTVALTGRDGGVVGRSAAMHINVPSDSTARVQEVHRTLLHAICELVENALCDG
jgi:D-sedoheptulose 7-phosphate isomerase